MTLLQILGRVWMGQIFQLMGESRPTACPHPLLLRRLTACLPFSRRTPPPPHWPLLSSPPGFLSEHNCVISRQKTRLPGFRGLARPRPLPVSIPFLPLFPFSFPPPSPPLPCGWFCLVPSPLRKEGWPKN